MSTPRLFSEPKDQSEKPKYKGRCYIDFDGTLSGLSGPDTENHQLINLLLIRRARSGSLGHRDTVFKEHPECVSALTMLLRRRAAENLQLNEGALSFIRWLMDQDIEVIILSKNRSEYIQAMLEAQHNLAVEDFISDKLLHSDEKIDLATERNSAFLETAEISEFTSRKKAIDEKLKNKFPILATDEFQNQIKDEIQKEKIGLSEDYRNKIKIVGAQQLPRSSFQNDKFLTIEDLEKGVGVGYNNETKQFTIQLESRGPVDVIIACDDHKEDYDEMVRSVKENCQDSEHVFANEKPGEFNYKKIENEIEEKLQTAQSKQPITEDSPKQTPK